MKPLRAFLMLSLGLGTLVDGLAQEEEETDITTYQAELSGSISSGKNTPFWMVSNRYGIVPLEANNGYLSAGVYHKRTFGKGFRWGAGLNVIAAVPRDRNVFLQQVYAELGYKCLSLSVGSKERYNSLWSRRLSSGDLVQSANARPIPEVNISIPEFTTIPLTKGWLQFKGDFAVGRSFDKDYLSDFANEEQVYINNVLWHHKSLFIQIKDTPHSLKDLIRVILGSEGGTDATASDQINVLGNHYGSYDFKLAFSRPDWRVSAYHQHYFEDKSGMIFVNGTDGLWGARLDLRRFPWLSEIVVEYLVTRDQSGSFHFIDFDHELHSGTGGGDDDYYNNGEYTTGSSYFNRAIGSPLIPGPEYNTDGALGFQNNRVRDWHIAAAGAFSPRVSYRLLLTFMNSWGRHDTPFLSPKKNVSGLLDITYRHPRLSGWTFTATLAVDAGSMFDDNFGCELRITKRGVLKKWTE